MQCYGSCMVMCIVGSIDIVTQPSGLQSDIKADIDKLLVQCEWLCCHL